MQEEIQRDPSTRNVPCGSSVTPYPNLFAVSGKRRMVVVKKEWAPYLCKDQCKKQKDSIAPWSLIPSETFLNIYWRKEANFEEL